MSWIMMLVGALAAVMMAGTPEAEAQTFTPPEWIARPDPDLTSQLSPGFAAGIGIDGTVVVHCLLEEDGHPFQCHARSETPAGLGFGAAARLVVASGRLRTGRLDGQPVRSWIKSTVRFRGCCEDGAPRWTGPEPTEAALRLARELVESDASSVPPEADRLEGLDHDRRPVVQAWLDELLPIDPERDIEVRSIQLGRVFSEADLRRMLAGETVEAPPREVWLDACPEPSESEQAALAELKRRYCDRWDCGT